MSLPTSVLGFGVGFLVGLTGMGGGAVMTPALILLGWSRPIVAVGTDLAWGAITRTVGAWVHYRQRTVDFTVVRRLALGSVPRGPRGSYRSRLPPPNPWSRRGGQACVANAGRRADLRRGDAARPDAPTSTHTVCA